MRNPLVILLGALAAISYATGDVRAGTVMCLMVVLGVLLKFIQETRANTAAAELKAMIKVTATVIREGQPKELPLGELVPGDIVKLSAGDMIPADLRVISSKDLFIIQASLTGESLPIEKFETKEIRDTISPLEYLQCLLSRHKCGKRHGIGSCCCDRQADILRQHGWKYYRSADRDKFR